MDNHVLYETFDICLLLKESTLTYIQLSNFDFSLFLCKLLLIYSHRLKCEKKIEWKLDATKSDYAK